MGKIYKKMAGWSLFRVVTNAGYTVVNGLLYIRMSALVDDALMGQGGLEESIKRVLFLAVILLAVGLLDSAVYGKWMKKSEYHLRMFYLNGIAGQRRPRASKGEQLSGYLNELNTIKWRLIDGLDSLISSLLGLFVSFWMLTNVNAVVVGSSVVLSILALLVSSRFLSMADREMAKRNEANARYVLFLRESLNGFPLIKSYILEKTMERQHREIVTDLKKNTENTVKWKAKAEFWQSMVMRAAVYGATMVAGVMVVLGKLGVGGILLTVEAASRFISDFGGLAMQIGQVATTRSTLQRVKELTGAAKKNKNKRDTGFAADESVGKEICFAPALRCDGVGFSYETSQGKKVLDRFQYEFLNGKKYLVTGASGCGKSTLLLLLCGWLTPTEGNIFLGETDLADVSERSLDRLVTLVRQEPYLFTDTVYHNLTMYHKIPEEEVFQVLQQVGLSEWIGRQENGIYGMLKDNGRNISGGEKARLALARALLKKSAVLLLDEVLSSLDQETGEKIERLLQELPDVMVILVSHVTYEANFEGYDAVLKLETVA